MAKLTKLIKFLNDFDEDLEEELYKIKRKPLTN